MKDDRRNLLLGAIILAALFAGTINATWIVTATDVVGPVQFVEIYFLSGQELERRSPNVGEEFRIAARIRNMGSTAFYYLPTLCDSSISALFEPFFVKVETDRPRCLALSLPTPLNPGEEVTVSGPESGTAYVAIRSGSAKATIVFSYFIDSTVADSSKQRNATAAVPLTIQDGSFGIPGFSAESLLIGLALALIIVVFKRRTSPKM